MDRIWLNSEWNTVSSGGTGGGGELGAIDSLVHIDDEVDAVDANTAYFLSEYIDIDDIESMSVNGRFVSKAKLGEGPLIFDKPETFRMQSNNISQDGKTWIPASNFGTAAWFHNHKGRLFAASSTASAPKVSTDGLNWSSIAGITAGCSNITSWENFVIIANSSTRTIYRSIDDGATFSSVTYGTSISIAKSLAFGAGVGVMVGTGSTYGIAYSTNYGSSWVGVSTGGRGFLSVKYHEGKFYAFGPGFVAVSSNGTTWSYYTAPLSQTSMNITKYDDGLAANSALFNTTTNKAKAINLLGTQLPSTLIKKGDGFVHFRGLGGGGSSTYGLGVIDVENHLSTIFDVYVPSHNAIITSTTTLNPVLAYDGTSYVMASGGPTNNVRVFKTSDFTTWSTSSSLPNYYWIKMMKIGSVWVVCGKNTSSGTTPYVYTSGDGLTWTSRSITGTSVVPAGMDYDGTTIIIAGTNGIIKSTNGIDYTGMAFGTSSSAVDIAYGNGIWVAPRSGGSAPLVSEDGGATWVAGFNVTGFTNPASFISFLDESNLFIMGNATGQIVTSPDGKNWTVKTQCPSTFSASASIIENGGVWYTSSGYYSTDSGLSWKLLGLNEFQQANGKYLFKNDASTYVISDSLDMASGELINPGSMVGASLAQIITRESYG